MASCPQIQESFDEQDIQLHLACPHLVRAAEICLGDTEVQANIIRTLSVLSEHQSCCDSLSDSSSRLGILLGPNVGDGLTAKPLGQIIRIGYILGNIMSRFDSARSQVKSYLIVIDSSKLGNFDIFSSSTMMLPWNTC